VSLSPCRRVAASSFILHPSSFTLHPSSFILHPSSFIPHPSSLIPHPSSLIPHPSDPHVKLINVLKDFLAFLFRLTPRRLRLILTRFGHARFIVSAGAVIINSQNQVLLLQHVFRTGSGWGIPGGFIDANEQPEAAVRRELQEEVGLELGSAQIALVRTFRHRQVELIFLCRPNGEAHPRGIEVKSAAWFALDALPEDLSEDQRRLITRVLSDGAKGRS